MADLPSPSTRPFFAEPNADNYCPCGPLEVARVSVSRCVERGEGVAFVIGKTGCGKTLLARVLGRQLRERGGLGSVLLLDSSAVTSVETFFQTVYSQLGWSLENLDENGLRLGLAKHLEITSEGLVFLVDDAHRGTFEVFEELRRLLDRGVRLVLIGNGALEETFTNPALNPLSQRIAVRAFLEPLGREETKTFLREQYARAGGDAKKVFLDKVCAEIHRLADGVPRVINQLADHVLFLAMSAKKNPLIG